MSRARRESHATRARWSLARVLQRMRRTHAERTLKTPRACRSLFLSLSCPQLLSVRGVQAFSADRNELLALLSKTIREARAHAA